MKFIKYFFSKCTHARNCINKRGQAAVLYALLTPILLLFIGVTFDLGWYYLNVSRLQNAADSAAVAGAQTILESNNKNFSSYKSVTLVKNYPGDEEYVYNLSDVSAEEVIEDSNGTAADYASKNLSRNAGWMLKGEDYVMMDAWSQDAATEVTMNPSIYKKGDELYYVIKLKEQIRHFFLPGWFDTMNAPVTAVAMITKNDGKVAGESEDSQESSDKPQPISTKPTPIESTSSARTLNLFDEATKVITEEFEEVLETLKNENVIVGNWEVQNYYRQITSSSNDKDSTGKALTRAQAYLSRYGYQVYGGAWNHFQDFYNHYTLGDLYRKQTVTILDDLVFQDNQNGIDYKYYDVNNKDKNKGDIISYGTNSSVAATSAAINTDKNSSAYNPEHKSTLKTHKSGIDEKDTVGLPYTAERLDSINIDFRPEVTLSGKWLSQDWDLTLDNFDGVTFNGNKKWSGSGSDANKIGDSKIRRMRIHTSINFDGVYKAREEQDSPDILWARIESEPMLSYPDEVNGYTTSNRGQVTGLNSVNQIIINANVSNKAEETRPVIIFYDGPERYGTKDENGNYIRESLPVILNLKESFRGVLYAPNSPVVVIGKKKSDFEGFVVAKKYMALKDDSYFVYSGEVRYFNNAERQWEYTREVDANGEVYYQDFGGTKVSDSVKTDSQAYRLKVYRNAKDPNDTKRYYKVVGKTANDTSTANTYETINGMKYIKIIEENGIDIYVDDYGEIQFVELSSPPTGCGTYSNFERTDFTTHNYHLLSSSSSNMLLSGN